VQPGEGYAIFEVRSPYVIVPLVGDLDTTADDREASVIRIKGTGVTLSVSLDNGLSWQDLAFAESTDLTALVSGRYGYLLRLTLRGRPEQALVTSLETTTWVQLHPASLPALRKGRNEMRYVTGDHNGLPTHVIELRTNGSDREDFLKHLSEPPGDLDPVRSSGRARGQFVARVTALPGMKIDWFSAGGNFATHTGESAPRTQNSMAWATDMPSGFKEFYRAAVPAGQDHWHYNADVEVKLSQPAKAVYIRYKGDPAVNNLRIYAHCVHDRPVASSSVEITHVWSERGARKTKTVRLQRPGAYEIVADDDPTDESIEISVLSTSP
jgi:hypothetical protein